MFNSHDVIAQLSSEWNYLDNILVRIIQLLNLYIERHGKVLVVRFDVRYPQSYPGIYTNSHISAFRAKLIQKYRRQGLDPYYMWAREQKTSSHPHYHCVLLLNGNLVKSYSHVFENAKILWSSTIKDSTPGLIHHCNEHPWTPGYRNGIMIIRCSPDAQFTYNAVVTQLSYLAKMADKRDYGDPWRNFGMSELH